MLAVVTRVQGSLIEAIDLCKKAIDAFHEVGDHPNAAKFSAILAEYEKEKTENEKPKTGA